MKKETRMLDCPISSEKVVELAQEMAKNYKRYDVINKRKEKFSDVFKDKLTEIVKRNHEISDSIDTGTEKREVEVELRFDYNAGIVEYYRLDNGEFLESREMREDERQQELNLGGKK